MLRGSNLASSTMQDGSRSTGTLFSKNGVYSEGLLERSRHFLGTSGNILLNASPLILSGSSFGESSGWVSPVLKAEGSGSGGFTSSGIIAAPYVSTSDTPIKPEWQPHSSNTCRDCGIRRLLGSGTTRSKSPRKNYLPSWLSPLSSRQGSDFQLIHFTGLTST